MGKVVASASMSLDGYIAKDDNTIGHLFDWFDNGNIEARTINPDITFHLNQSSFDYWQGWVSSLGALVCGRTLFDFTDGWDGRHTIGVPVVVVTHEAPADWISAHPDASLEFVTDGVEAAVARAQEIAGDRNVAVAAGTVARQCLELGLLDEIAIDLTPVVFGGGRPYFGDLSPGDIPLGEPTTCIPSDGVIHLVYPARRA
jgi:dihydrofolate reductase